MTRSISCGRRLLCFKSGVKAEGKKRKSEVRNILAMANDSFGCVLNNQWANVSTFLTCAFCLLPFALIEGGAQQASPQAPPKFTAGVDVIEMDVSVLDKDRKPIHGLTQPDFVVREDGKPQRIVAFSEFVPPPVTPPSAPWMRTVAPDVQSNDIVDKHLFVIVMDDAMAGIEFPIAGRGPRIIDAREIATARTIAKRAVDTMNDGEAAAVIFTWDNHNGVSFTPDRAKLIKAIDTYTAGPPHDYNDPFDCRPWWQSASTLRDAVD